MLNVLPAILTPVIPLTDYESIATTTVGAGGTSTITFSSIPSTYKHLQLRASGANGGTIRFNGDTTTTNYRYHYLSGDGATAGSGTAQNAYWPVSGSVNRTVDILDILDYSNTSKNKTLRTLGGWDNNGSGEVWISSDLWLNTAAISSIVISGTFAQYSSFALYGVK